MKCLPKDHQFYYESAIFGIFLLILGINRASNCPGVKKIGRREHNRRKGLVALCDVRPAIRLLYFCILSLREQFFCYPPVIIYYISHGIEHDVFRNGLSITKT